MRRTACSSKERARDGHRGAGAIPIARTNLPDMGLRLHTFSSLHGLTGNPWNPNRTAGGSSGGEAAALASGMSPIGLGSDLGGSLRSPANACGIASIRPSAGRVPEAGFVPREDRLLAVQLMNVQGPMARRVADVRLGLRVLMGAHPRDPWSIDVPFDGPPQPKPIRVAVLHVDAIDDKVMREFIPWRRDYYSKFEKLPKNAKLHPTDKTLQWDMMLGKAIVRWASGQGLRGKQALPTVTFTPKKKRVRPAFELWEFRQLWWTLCKRVKTARDKRTLKSRELLRAFVLVLANSGIRLSRGHPCHQGSGQECHSDVFGKHVFRC